MKDHKECVELHAEGEPSFPDCFCRLTKNEKDCALAGCGFCKASILPIYVALHFEISVSSARRWLSGESKPHPKIQKLLNKFLKENNYDSARIL